MPHEQRAAHAAKLKAKRDYRLVVEDGVAPADELQRDYEAAVERQRKLYGAAPSTVEAVMYELREYGISQLPKPNTQRRIAELSDQQLQEVIGRLEKLRPKYPLIDDALISALMELKNDRP